MEEMRRLFHADYDEERSRRTPQYIIYLAADEMMILISAFATTLIHDDAVAAYFQNTARFLKFTLLSLRRARALLHFIMISIICFYIK